jgi:hypothetical protein
MNIIDLNRKISDLMNKTPKVLLIFICILLGVLTLYYLISPIFIPEESFNGFSGDENNTIIISSSTGDMKGLEVGVASYAGYEGIPLVLSSKTIPYPLNEWITLLKERNYIHKVILVGPVSRWQVYSLKLQNFKIEIINGSSKSEILTKMAQKTYKSMDTVIITASDPSASLLGAVLNVPVFVVAEPGKYTSSDILPLEYSEYISKYQIKKVIVVGQVSTGIINDLNAKNLVLENITGNDSFQTSTLVSDRIIDIQKQRGVEVNSAYCGFYGELPSIVPLAAHNNSIILQDPTLHMDETVDYLKNKNIDTAIITRNGPADYLQMEEPDFVSSRLITKLSSNGIKTYNLTNFRTINEATGLYETKIMATEIILGTGGLWGNHSVLEGVNADGIDGGPTQNETSTYPPLLDIIIKGSNWDTSTGSQLNIRKIGLNEWYYHWKGIHPYIWYRNNSNDWYCYSGSGYSWHWIHANKTENGIYTNDIQDTWTVEYLSNKKVYYRVYWIKKGNLWEEIHTEASYDWQYNLNFWICKQKGNNQSLIIYPAMRPLIF